MKNKEVLVIMPAYNEEHTIEGVLEQLEQPDIADIADVLVMNDHSSDATNHIVKKRGHALVTHVFNLGYGGGLRLGYKYAIRRKYKYVIQMDADGQHDVSNIPVIYEELKKADADGKTPDIVLGSRFVEGSAPFEVSLAKKIAFVLFRFLIKKGTGQKIMDPTTGLQGLSWRAVLFYSKYGNFDDRYPDANMIMQMIMLGFRVKEVPAVMHQRTSGESMHSGVWKPMVYMIRMVFSIAATMIRVKRLKWNQGVADEETYVEN